MAPSVTIYYTSFQNQSVPFLTIQKPLSVREKIHPFLGSVLEQTFPLGDLVSVITLSERVIAQLPSSQQTILPENPVNADEGNYTQSALSGITGVYGVFFHALNLSSAVTRKDTEGKKIFSSQIVRFLAKQASVATQIAYLILSKSGQALAMALQKASTYLGTLSTLSGTVAFGLRVWDMSKIKKCKDAKEIYNTYLRPGEDESEDVKAGKIDRLSRAIGSRDLVDKIYNTYFIARQKNEPNTVEPNTAELDSAEVDNAELNAEIKKSLKSNHKKFGVCLAAFIVTDIVNIVSIAVPILKMVGMGISLAVNVMWLGIDGKFLIDDLNDKKEISTALKVIYVAQIALAVSSIVLSSVFTFGAVPIAIGIASVAMSAVPFLIRYFHQKKGEAALSLQKPPLESNPNASNLSRPYEKTEANTPPKDAVASNLSPVKELPPKAPEALKASKPRRIWGIAKPSSPHPRSAGKSLAKAS